MNKIEAQTKALEHQLTKLQAAVTDEDYHRELEWYNQMVKEADFSPESQAASKKTKLTIADKVLVPPIKWATKHVDKMNDKLIERNKRGKK